MQPKTRIISSLLMVALLLSVGGVSAESGAAPRMLAGPVGTGFNYQGVLKDSDGNPITNSCDFQFTLWDNLSSGMQIGITSTVSSVNVAQGNFTILVNAGGEFGASAFNGQARWLAIAVRCPAATGSYTPLTPRQALTSVPYALALPGLYTQQNTTSPNIIGGYSDNGVTVGVVGATISGGGAADDGYGSPIPNIVSGHYGTIGGGYDNQAGSSGTVSGGMHNIVCQGGAIGGGTTNQACGSWATVAGGLGNAATNGSATVSGGTGNTASGAAATVGGGANNRALGENSTVSGGGETYPYRGNGNVAGGDYSAVPGGKSAYASLYGQMAYASGQFESGEIADGGNAQTSIFVLRNVTTNTVPIGLYLDGAGSRITITTARTLTFDSLVVARSDVGASAGYKIQGVIENNAGTTSFIGTPTVTTFGEDVAAWDVSVLADDTNDALVIQVTGAASTTIRWVATVRTAEVSW